jgi:3-oxoadipate enol-lactonase
MKPWLIAIIGLAVLLLVGVGAAGWMVLKRPLATFAWLGERALGKAGLQRVTVEAAGGEVAVWHGGRGPTLVLLHGAGDRAASWAQVAPALVGSYRLVIPDLPGHGRSEPRSGPIDFATLLAGVEAVVAGEPADRPVTVVGNSLGAWLAMVMAHRHPGRFALIVAVDGGAIIGHESNAVVLPKNREEARRSVALTRDPGSPAVPGFVLDDIVRQAKTGPLARFAATAATMTPWLMDGRLAEITAPVDLIWGESDRLFPLDYAHRMMAELPGAHLTVIPHCGHVPQIECPAAFSSALKAALGPAT